MSMSKKGVSDDTPFLFVALSLLFISLLLLYISLSFLSPLILLFAVKKESVSS